jgi:glycosyltransferase involved in cell wall biosynthesis
MAEYILATKFYNEQEQLPSLIENIAEQTLKPTAILFVDDGSIDRSSEIARKTSENFGIEYEIVSMPKKQKGNLDTLGRAWTLAQPSFKRLSQSVRYVATTDVDTTFPPSYFEEMVAYMDGNPRVGVVSGQISGAPLRSFPMFTGKVIRSEVIQSIDKYWDISIDSFLNVKALKLGFVLKILDHMLVEAPLSHLRTKKGRFRAGRLAYYAGTTPVYAIFKALLQRDTGYLRGYWMEYFQKKWRCDDPDILEYYQNEFKRKVLASTKKALRL